MVVNLHEYTRQNPKTKALFWLGHCPFGTMLAFTEVLFTPHSTHVRVINPDGSRSTLQLKRVIIGDAPEQEVITAGYHLETDTLYVYQENPMVETVLETLAEIGDGRKFPIEVVNGFGERATLLAMSGDYAWVQYAENSPRTTRPDTKMNDEASWALWVNP